MRVDEFLANATNTMFARRVYAEPVERAGITLVAAAAIAGGGGGGSGTEEETGKEGSGGGFGVGAKPVGAYVIKDGRVSWRPALDINRLITVLGAVAVAALVVRGRTVGQSIR
jgi:uncharacterized spore protein YtfJ